MSIDFTLKVLSLDFTLKVLSQDFTIKIEWEIWSYDWSSLKQDLRIFLTGSYKTLLQWYLSEVS